MTRADNSGLHVLVPRQGPDRIVSEPGLHDQGIFARIEIVAVSTSDDLEPEAAIERDGGRIARTHLEEGQGDASGHALRERGGQDGPSHPPMTPVRVYGEIGDV